MSTIAELPKPECEYGYTVEQVKEIMGDDVQRFYHWMRGQTMAICEGNAYNHDTKEYEEACGGVSHGYVTYGYDIERFLAGLPVID